MIHPRFREVEVEYDDDTEAFDVEDRYSSGSHAVAERYAELADNLYEKEMEAAYGNH